MPDAPLLTKLTIPPARRDLVARPRLIEVLNRGLERKLILLSAPAGFGKTTLLSAWLKETGLAAAWFSLDEGDNDPACFLRGLFAALERAGVQTGRPENEPFLAPGGLAPMLGGLVNRLAVHPRDIILVLDDYHLITHAEVQDGVALLIERLPETLHLVIATRADPPLPLARLRAHGQLAELNLAGLRFTHEEALVFLNQGLRLGLSEEEAGVLVQRTEGWIAGLQMAALSLQNNPDTARFIRDFAGSNRYVMDYLLEEVLQRRAPEEQAFLLRTSILETMCGPLCEAVAGLAEGEGQAMLERLEHANLFILPQDDRRAWYRYHHLFADLLARQLKQNLPKQAPELHRRAACWYEANGMTAEAVQHALSGGDIDRAGRLIEGAAEEMLMHSQAATLLRWVNALPAGRLDDYPMLGVYHTWALLYNGAPFDSIQARLNEIERGGAVPAGFLNPLRAYLSVLQWRFDQAVPLAQAALAELPEDDRFLRTVSTWMISLRWLFSANRLPDPDLLEQVIQASQRAGNLLVAVLTLCSLGDQILSRGHMQRARETYQRALDLAVDARGEPLPVSGMPLARLGEILREQNRLEEAEPLLKEGIRRISAWDDLTAISAYLSLAMTQQARGDAGAAAATLQKAGQMAARFDATDIDDRIVALYRVQVGLIQGDLAPAKAWLETSTHPAGPPEGYGERHLFLRSGILQARALLALERPAEALALLAPILPELEGSGRRRRMTEVLGLMALALAGLGRQGEALRSLERMLLLAREEGFVRTIADLGEGMRVLLVEAARRGIVTGYARVLLTAFPQQEQQEPLFEALSERELDVLRLLSEGHSNQEIAEKLYVTLRTVKFHTGNILGKLGVKNRTQAVARARELGIIKEG